MNRLLTSLTQKARDAALVEAVRSVRKSKGSPGDAINLLAKAVHAACLPEDVAVVMVHRKTLATDLPTERYRTLQIILSVVADLFPEWNPVILPADEVPADERN